MSQNSKRSLPKVTEVNSVKEIVGKTEVQPLKKANQSGSSQQFLQLFKMFSIDGGLVPEDKKLVIEDRAQQRVRNTQVIKQKNIENITKQTITYCASKDISQRVDYDWLSRYIELAEGISNTTMQDLWAKILAAELMRPGSYSYKAIKLLREMSIFDAKLLAKACSLSVKDSRYNNVRIISGAYQKTSLLNFLNRDRQVNIDLSNVGLNHTDILSLAESHLIYAQESESNSLSKGEGLVFTYSGSNLSLVSKKSGVSLQFYKFTPVGAELAKLITGKRNEQYLSAIKESLSVHFHIAIKS